MSNTFDPNRRRFPRAEFPCQITVWPVSNDTQVLMAQTTNIGAGGVCVHINQRLSIGTQVQLRVDFSDTSIPFKCKGTIVRSIERANNVTELGIEFDGLDEVKQSFLMGKVSELMDKERDGK